jgi:hypothetical protein
LIKYIQYEGTNFQYLIILPAESEADGKYPHEGHGCIEERQYDQLLLSSNLGQNIHPPIQHPYGPANQFD